MKLSLKSPVTRYVVMSIVGCLVTVIALVFIVYRRTSHSFEEANIALLRQNVVTVDSSLRAFMEGDPRNSVGFPKYMEKLRGTHEVVEAEAKASRERFEKFRESIKDKSSALGGKPENYRSPLRLDEKLEYELRVIPADVTRQSTLKNALARIKSELQELPEWKSKSAVELETATKSEYERLYPTADPIERSVLENAQSYEEWDEQASVFRMTVPVAAAKSCLDCHNVASEGQPLGAITVIHSLDRAQAMKTALTREIGILAAFSVVCLLIMGLWNANKLQKVLGSVGGAVLSVSQQLQLHVETLKGATTGVESGTTRQRQALQKTHDAVDAMNESSRQTVDNATKSTESIGRVDGALLESAGIVQRMTDSMADIRTASNEVAGITKVINEVAFKTNLLAINAAIEAARAGEAGRGFAVVADEVRSLAKHSAKAASEVDVKIASAIQKSAAGAQISEELNATFKTISQSVKESREFIAKIVEASALQSKSAEVHNCEVNSVGQLLDVTCKDVKTSQDVLIALEEESKKLELSLDALRNVLSVQVPKGPTLLTPSRPRSEVRSVPAYSGT